MKFAFIIMGEFDSRRDRASIREGAAQIIGVSSLEEACSVAVSLREAGVGCIELCGAFGPEGARAVAAATQESIPVGYISHLPEQEAVYRAAFPPA